MNNTKKLERLTKNYAAPKVASFRDFTQTDWYGYAGCETDNPQIAELSWGDVVIDGCTVGAHPHEYDSDECWMFTFASLEFAREVAERIVKGGTDTLPKFLEQVN